MTGSIPISKEVTVVPGVVGTGGNPLSLNSVFLTQNTRAPNESLLSFSNSDDVGAYFGLTSTEYNAAICYFAGFDNSSTLPGTLYFYGFATVAAPAWLRGSILVGQLLTYFTALSGSLAIVINGVTYTAATLNLASGTSIGGSESTSIANLIKTGLGFTGGTAPTITWDSTRSQFVITSYATGDGVTIAYATGTLADPLGLSSGILSQGDSIDSPDEVMTDIANQSNDWATFLTLWETANYSIPFAQWAQTQNGRYSYILWDSDIGNKTANNSTTIGSIIAAAAYDGVIVCYSPAGGQYLASAIAGYAAAINWSAYNGRATLKFRQQSGLASYVTPITSSADANAILSNNATYYGTYSAPGLGNSYNIIADGRMSGSKFKWIDTYLGQIYLNSQLALSIFEGLLQVNLAPYNEAGNSLIRSWCADPISEAINNGVIRSGVQLSNSQKADINNAVGKDISTPLQTTGYYLNILPATAQVRGQRASPPIQLYYVDGGAIQQVTLNSIVVL